MGGFGQRPLCATQTDVSTSSSQTRGFGAAVDRWSLAKASSQRASVTLGSHFGRAGLIGASNACVCAVSLLRKGNRDEDGDGDGLEWDGDAPGERW